MNYFRALGLIFGLAALLKPIYMHLIPWDENRFIANTYTERRPRWIAPVAALGLVLVVLTWYMHFTLGVEHSIILTVLFSLTALKAITLLFDYSRFQQWVGRMLAKDKGRDIVLIDVLTGLFGLAVVLLALFIY